MKSGIVLGLTALFFICNTFQNAEAKMTIPQVTNMMMPMRKTCIGKTGVSPELVDAPKTGPMPDAPELKCYYSCLLKMVKATTKEGLPNPENMFKQMDLMLNADATTARLKELVNQCAPAVTSTDPCESNWQYVTCIYDADKELAFFP